MCWLYSVPNLLLFQQLDTLNLGGNHVRVVCERVWRIQVCVHSEAFSRLELMSGSRLMTRQNATCVKHARSWRVMIARALQDKEYSLAWELSHDSNLRLIPVVSELVEHPILQKKWLFTFLTYPTINTLIPTKCREFPERILREKP